MGRRAGYMHRSTSIGLRLNTALPCCASSILRYATTFQLDARGVPSGLSSQYVFSPLRHSPPACRRSYFFFLSLSQIGTYSLHYSRTFHTLGPDFPASRVRQQRPSLERTSPHYALFFTTRIVGQSKSSLDTLCSRPAPRSYRLFHRRRRFRPVCRR